MCVRACVGQFVLHHAPGVRRLRFIRKLPLLKGLSDQAIIKVGERVTEEVFEVRMRTHTHFAGQQTRIRQQDILPAHILNTAALPCVQSARASL